MDINIGQYSYQSEVQFKDDKGKIQKTVMKFLLYLPNSYGQQPQQKWPLILFLHGSGERGNDPNLLKNHPLPMSLEHQSDFPFIVLSPQMPEDESWQNDISTVGTWWEQIIAPVLALLEQVQSQYSVDNQRVYLTGISMGGFGTWRYALRYPQRFAAIVPVAGGYSFRSTEIPQNIDTIKDFPIWAFHGDTDITVLPYQSELLTAALRKHGGNIKFTLYPGLGHDDIFWSKVYTDPDLYRWLLEQKKK